MRKAILAGALMIISAAFNASAEAPNLFTYQGRLKEGGQAVSGNRTVEIKLCPVETGGSCETSGAQPVAVSNGLFRSTFTIPAAVNFGTGSWWLEIWVGGDQLTPRERLTSNAYSLFSATAAYAENISAAAGSDGVYISSNLYVTGGKYYGDGSQLQNLPVSGGAVAKTGDAMTGQLTLYGSTLTVGGNAFSVGGGAFKLEGGKVGIGTVAPSGILEINGTDNPQLLLTDLSGDVTFAMRYSNGAPRHILGVPYYNDRVVLTNRAAPFPSQPDSALLLWDSGVTTLQMGTGGYLSFVAGTATEKARFTPQGNFGIGTTAPGYRLVVSSAAGEAGNMLVISTGTSDVIRLTGAGEIYANYYHGDGSQLSGVTATITDGSVTLAKMANMATASFLGRNTAGAGAPEVLDAATVKSILSLTKSDVGLASVTDEAQIAKTIGTSKGDIIAFSAAGTPASLAVGANGTVFMADSAQLAGVKWAALAKSDIALGNVDNVQQLPMSYLDTDNTLAADSDAKVSSQKAIKAFVATGLAGKLSATGDGSGLQNIITSTAAIVAALGAKYDSGNFAAGTNYLAPNGNGSGLTGVITSTAAIVNALDGKVGLSGDEAIAGLKVFTSTVSVNHSVLVKGNYSLMLSTNIGYGGGLRHDQSGNETMVMAVRNANSKIYLATGYDVTPNAGGALALPASPEITVFNGMVGIKDTTPNSELDVTGQVNATGGLCIGGNCKTSWSSVDNLGDHTATQALNMADRPINSISTASLNGVIISSGTGNNYFAGNVGIGTNAPANPLEVNGVIKSLAGGFSFPDGTTMTSAAGVGTGYASVTDITMAADTDGNGTGILTFATKGSERMRVDNDGNVGVGLTAPAARLDVQAAGMGDLVYTQIWRDSSGVIRASMTASGKLFADISAVAGGGDNLGNHNASNNLQLNWNNIYTVSTITAAGDITAARYQIDGSTVLAVLPGLKSLGIGVGAGQVSQANENTFVGYNAGAGNTTGGANTFIGALAGGSNSNGSNNTFFGPYAGNSNSGGNRNSFYGVSSGFNNNLGSDNAFYGAEAGRNNTGGNNNTALGVEAMKGTASNNISGVTAVGYQAGAALTTGNYNTLIGHQAGDTLTTGTGNIVIGSGQDATAPTISDELNIGGLLRGNLNAGTIGIGFTNTIPLAALDVKSTGTAANVYAQVWRDSDGAVVASMTAAGLLNVNSIAAGAFAGKFVPVYSFVTGGDVTTTGQTLSDITGLSVALSAGAVYEFEAQLSCGSSADSNGNQYGVNFNAAGSSVEAILYGDTGATMNSERINNLYTATSSYLGAPNATGGILIKGLITTTINPGNLTIQHLKVTSGTSTVYLGSYLKVTRIN